MEIERKFLTTAIPFTLADYPSVAIEQAYISFSPTIRIRKSNEDYILTVKGHGHLSREEWEMPLTKEEYTTLQEKCDTPPVVKKRYFVPLEGGLTAEVDVYEGQLEGLLTTEVEFSSEEAANAFVPPLWFGKDVTFDPKYKNTDLSRYGKPVT